MYKTLALVIYAFYFTFIEQFINTEVFYKYNSIVPFTIQTAFFNNKVSKLFKNEFCYIRCCGNFLNHINYF